MRRTILLLVSSSLFCLGAVGCSSSSSGGAQPDSGDGNDGGVEACVPYVSTVDVTTPTVTFKKDVAPVFQMSCAIAGATCHGAVGVASQGRP
ncbi:MAG TPA: hypothetical protein VIF15_08640, partial [Polyangiaceae bacterium]